MSERIQDYASFFPFYLAEHSKSACRAFHYAGTFLSTVVLVSFFVTGEWLYLAVWPVVGYGLAWYSHFFIEKNRPATFSYPFWSLISDYYMTFLWLTGQLKPHLENALAGRASGQY